MVVNPSVPARSVPEFIAYAKANPRKVNMASNGKGGLLHLAGELWPSREESQLQAEPDQENCNNSDTVMHAHASPPGSRICWIL